MPTALAISPHLDDAVFSAGGALARLAKHGWRVTVATVFSDGIPDPHGFALACQVDKGLAPDVDYMALRRAEDAVACAAIGANPLWLHFLEAPHRGYASAAELFCGIRDDDRIVARIEPVLLDLIRSQAPDEIFAPQAIGAHVDHVAVYMALRSMRFPVKLWTDFPYASRASTRDSPFEEIAAFDKERVDLTPYEFEAKVAATMAYASQLDFQFGGGALVEASLARHGNVEFFRRTGR